LADSVPIRTEPRLGVQRRLRDQPAPWRARGVAGPGRPRFV